MEEFGRYERVQIAEETAKGKSVGSVKMKVVGSRLQ